MNNAFSKKHSLAIKGAGILMMLWHHCLGLDNLTANPWPFNVSQIHYIAVFCKICVSLFAFVSGYGLWLNYSNEKGPAEKTFKWVVLRLIRTLSSYWLVVALSWIICNVINGWTRDFYFAESPLLGIWNMCMDFLGLTNLFGGEPLNPIWWYMGAAVMFVVILPPFDKLMEWLGSFCAIVVVCLLSKAHGEYPGGQHFLSFLPMFCIGAVFAKGNIFEHWTQFWRGRRGWVRYPILIIGMGIAYKLYHVLDITRWWIVKFTLIPLAAIFLIWEVVKLIHPLKSILCFLGRHATNIFLVHAFLYAYYFSAFIYRAGHWALILCRLLWSSLLISLVLEGIKKLIRYDFWIEKIARMLVKNIGSESDQSECIIR